MPLDVGYDVMDSQFREGNTAMIINGLGPFLDIWPPTVQFCRGSSSGSKRGWAAPVGFTEFEPAILVPFPERVGQRAAAFLTSQETPTDAI